MKLFDGETKGSLKVSLFLLLSLFFLSTPAWASWDFQRTIDHSTEVIKEFKKDPKNGIPQSVFDKAKGVAVIRVSEAGFIFSGESGHGLVVARKGQSWTAPSAISVSGMGFGLQVGGETTHYVLILNTKQAVDNFARGGKLKLKGEMEGVAGPTTETERKPKSHIYVYKRSKGFFGGLALSGLDIAESKDTNKRYYHKEVSSKEILSGKVAVPKGAQKLIHALNAPYGSKKG
ncbi:lipid-binding SYLF domain-containing protein [Candidatus Methylacidiphilum infernorum]|uniref:Lipid-binding SYLF domain-containing protein n=1 Tax=Candidatus Methylacidiphilum infernorum TaxID=511746 RepID=A0ABX7PUK8_9BACT|nr:lipid-binding SYLF domain-containing protein [Candidatus Methylacidiphilum infernorum]QSR86356.1 lipid-binding SYLF domain-containing protein [Candidatus Methylacidiphilum infernorum]